MSISACIIVMKMTLKTAADFSKLLRKYHLKDLGSMNRLCVLHPILDAFGLLLSLSGKQGLDRQDNVLTKRSKIVRRYKDCKNVPSISNTKVNVPISKSLINSLVSLLHSNEHFGIRYHLKEATLSSLAIEMK